MKRIKGMMMITGLLLSSVCIFTSCSGKQQTIAITEKPQRGDISNTVTSTGTVQPVNTVSVGSQVSGTIEKLYVDFNSVVKKGQLLAELDKTLFQAAFDQAKSNYEQVQSQLTYQKSNYERQSQLYNVGAISKAEYEKALFSYNSAKAQAKVSYAQVQSAKKNLSLASIYSPIDGTVLSRSVSEGQTVAASFSTPTIFAIAKDLKEMQVEASVDEADIGYVKEGDRVTFSVDAYANDIFEGTLQQIRLNPTTTNNVVTYTTIIKTSNEDLKLKPGMTANITIYTAEVKNALTIPVKATKFSPDSTYEKYQIVASGQKISEKQSSVWIKQDNKLVQKIIKTGLNNNEKIEVLDGLSGNEDLVVGSRQISSKDAAPAESNSPFMPKRPGGNKSPKKN